MNHETPPQQVRFDSPPEIFATDTAGRFHFPLRLGGELQIATAAYDEVRFVLSIWHPSPQRAIDLDRAFVEIACSFESDEEHWIKLAEIEPVVPPYNAGDSFDGWIVLPVLGAHTAYAVGGSGFEPRARVQVRANAYLVA